MAQKSLKEFQGLSDPQLDQRAAELRRELFDLRTQAATDKVKDMSRFKKIRRDIARVLTIRSERAAGKVQA